MKLDKEKDIAQRKRDSGWDVELFRWVHGRLPNQEGDDVTKRTAKKYIDRFIWGKEEPIASMMKKENLDMFAFHVYASSNLAYVNDLSEEVCDDCGGDKPLDTEHD